MLILMQEILPVIGMSLIVSMSSTVIAAVSGITIGILAGLKDFRMKKLIVRLLETLMSTPPVLMGLLVYLLLSRRGVCTNVNGNFELLEEHNKISNKDTSLLLASGAEKVFWLKCLNNHIHDGIKFFMNQIPKDALIICESNSLRNIVIPGSFIMLKNTKNDIIKQSASEVIHIADIILENDFENSIKTLAEKIKIEKNKSNFVISIPI